MENGLRQGCCMATVLFNLYTCLEVERWLVRMGELESLTSTSMMRSYSGGTREMQVTGESLSTSLLIALLATTRSGAERSAIGYQRTSSEFGLKVSLPETKLIDGDRQDGGGR